MARPRRPSSERAAVIAAVAGMTGSAAHRARRLATAVTERAMREIDDPDDRLVVMLAAMTGSPIDILASDGEIDTGALIRAARAAATEARGGRRLPEREWAAEDREIARSVRATLAKRYARLIKESRP